MTATVDSAGGRFPALAAPIACGCCLLAGAAYVTAVDPGEGGLFLPCPFRTLTGWWCPGCGLTRATHHLLRGDLIQALRFNIFVVVVLGGFAGAWLVWTMQMAGRPLRQVRVPNFVYAACAAALVGFAIIRNLPGVPGLRG